MAAMMPPGNVRSSSSSLWDLAKSEGTCLCGAIKVTVVGEDFADGKPRGHLCHCFTCRRSTGTDYAHNLRLRESSVVIIPRYKLSEYRGISKAGNPFVRTFCSTCGSTITSKNLTPDFATDVLVRMGLFPVIPAPIGEICEDEKVEWLKNMIRDGWQHNEMN